MKKFTYPSILGLCFGALGLLLAACGQDSSSAQTASGQGGQFTIGDAVEDSTIAAVVSSEFGADTLSMQEFHLQMQNIGRFYPQAMTDPNQLEMIRASMVEQFADRHLLLGEARKRGLEADRIEVEAHLANIRDQFDDEEAFQAALNAQDMTEDALRAQIQEQASVESLLESLAAGTPDPDAEEVERYRENQARQVRAEHILFMVDRENPEEDASARAHAQAVLDSIQAGADFQEMARRHSDDPGSAEQGGDLGFFSRGRMVPEFEEAVFGLDQEGDVTPELVGTQYGYHIIRLVDRREEEYMPQEQAQEGIQQNDRQQNPGRHRPQRIERQTGR
jgi:peptidyl-prolyl cis-trans isomerase C